MATASGGRRKPEKISGLDVCALFLEVGWRMLAATAACWAGLQSGSVGGPHLCQCASPKAGTSPPHLT